MNPIRDQFPIFAAQPAALPLSRQCRHGPDLPGRRRGAVAVRNHRPRQRQAGRLPSGGCGNRGIPAGTRRGRGLSRRRRGGRGGVHLRLHARDQHRRPRPRRPLAGRRRDPDLASSSITATSCLGRWPPSRAGAGSAPSRSPRTGASTCDRLDEARLRPHAGHRRHPRLQRDGCGHGCRPPARGGRRRRRRSGARRCPARAARSTRRAGARLRPLRLSPATRCSARPGPGSCGAGASSWPS